METERGGGGERDTNLKEREDARVRKSQEANSMEWEEYKTRNWLRNTPVHLIKKKDSRQSMQLSALTIEKQC